MKFSSRTLRTFTTLHGWVGVVAGFALFVAFYAGAITVFQQPLQRWASMHDAGALPTATIGDAQSLLDQVLARHPAARTHVGMTFPGSDYAVMSAYWQDADGTWQFATAGDATGGPEEPGAALPELVNELHYALGAPPWGTWLMGLVALLYGVALVSGVVIHLPTLVGHLFALRPGHNLKRFWQDAHNVIGVFSLPFHMLFAITGAVLCLLLVAMLALNPLVFRGQLMTASGAAMNTAPVRAASGHAEPLLPLSRLRQRAVEVAAEQGVTGFRPTYLKLANAGDAHAVIEITGISARGLGAGAVALDATDGRALATQLPGHRDANHATLATAYALHYGDYGNAVVPWLYFLLGVGGSFLFYSGNLLWIEKRRKRRQPAQGRAPLAMARATVGVCIGLCVAVSASFVAAQLLPALGLDDRYTYGVCFVTWAACLGWACRRPPIRAARHLLWLAAAMTAVVPLVHGVTTGWWPWHSLAAAQPDLAGVDLVALAMACGFAALARSAARRARHGTACSVWADPRQSGTP